MWYTEKRIMLAAYAATRLYFRSRPKTPARNISSSTIGAITTVIMTICRPLSNAMSMTAPLFGLLRLSAAVSISAMTKFER